MSSTDPSPHAHTHPPRSLLTLRLCLGELRVLQLGQEEAGPALQVGAGHVELHVGHQLLEAGEVRGLTEVLGVLVQPGAQDGGDGTGGRRAGSRVRGLASPSTRPSPGSRMGAGLLGPPLPHPHRAARLPSIPGDHLSLSRGTLTLSCLPPAPRALPPGKETAGGQGGPRPLCSLRWAGRTQ